MASLALRSLPRLLCTARVQIARAALSTSSASLAADRHYTKKHEWVTIDGDIATVGISTFAQEALGDIVYVELPEMGAEVTQGETAGAVESVKAASDVYSPLSGVVTERNAELESTPSLINKSTYEKGWIYKIKVKDAGELKNLMDESAYQVFKKQEEAEH